MDATPIIELLKQFDPEPEGLLREISKHIDDEMLEEIAAADYGSRMEEHLVALRQVRDTGTFPEKMYWCPCEVLELIRYSEPENPEWKPGRTGSFGHWMRAFSSAALLRALAEPWNYTADAAQPSYSLIQLIHSLLVLPIDFYPHATRFLAWLLLNSEPEGQDEQVCYYGIGLLWFALHLKTPQPDKVLVLLSEWIVRREEELAARYYGYSARWLLGIGGRNAPPSPWEILGVQLCELDLSRHQLQLREWVSLIGHELAG